ncbi:MAG: hypothetical protein NZ811_07160 [Gammaproteobacteria bacterium]|nr:hypothetical protein [Gammaproteobacteria bacterium]
MCDPISMAMMAAIGTASDISATNQAAEDEQDAAVAQQSANNLQNALAMEETNAKAGLELTQKKREGQRERATAKVSAAESGAQGGVALRNLANVYVNEAITSGSIVSLAESDIVRLGTQSQADFIRQKSVINTAEGKKTTGLSAVLQIGVSAGTAYANGGGFTGGTPAVGSTPAVSNWQASKKAFGETWSW